jgi:hypothetical protein
MRLFSQLDPLSIPVALLSFFFFFSFYSLFMSPLVFFGIEAFDVLLFRSRIDALVRLEPFSH